MYMYKYKYSVGILCGVYVVAAVLTLQCTWSRIHVDVYMYTAHCTLCTVGIGCCIIFSYEESAMVAVKKMFFLRRGFLPKNGYGLLATRLTRLP